MDDNSYKEISLKIKVTRAALGYSQEYVAQKLGISQNVYSRNERQIKNIPLERLVRIFEILDINIEEMFKR